MATALLIETPTDFRESMGAKSHQLHVLCKVVPQFEPTLRHALDSIFNDLSYIDTQDPAMVSNHLDGIEEPLRRLGTLGAALFALTTKGTTTVADKKLRWTNTHYFVIVKGSYFAIGENLSNTVHQFDPNCAAAIKDLSSVCATEGGMSTYANKQLLLNYYERSVPWCPECRLSEIG